MADQTVGKSKTMDSEKNDPEDELEECSDKSEEDLRFVDNYYLASRGSDRLGVLVENCIYLV